MKLDSRTVGPFQENCYLVVDEASNRAVLIDPGANLIRYGRLSDTTNAETISVEVRDPARPEYGMITMVFTRSSRGPGGPRRSPVRRVWPSRT